MVFISNAFSGQCLDWTDQIIVAATCNGSSEQQKWTYAEQTLRIPLSRCMDCGGVSLHVWPCAAGGPMSSNQRWSYSSSAGLLQNGGTHACLHLEERGHGSSQLSLLPCRVAETRQKWVLRAHPPHVPQTATSSSSSSTTRRSGSRSISSRSSITSATPAADISRTTGTPIHGTNMSAKKLERAKETTQERRSTTKRREAASTTGVLKPTIEPTISAGPKLPLSIREKPAGPSIEVPTAETPLWSRGARIPDEKQPPTTSMVAGLDPPAVKSDAKKRQERTAHEKADSDNGCGNR